MNNNQGIILDEIEINGIKYILWQNIENDLFSNSIIYRTDDSGVNEIENFEELEQVYMGFLNANSKLSLEEKKDLIRKFELENN